MRQLYRVGSVEPPPRVLFPLSANHVHQPLEGIDKRTGRLTWLPIAISEVMFHRFSQPCILPL